MPPWSPSWAVCRLPRPKSWSLGLKLRPDETTGFLRACADDTRARLAALFVDVGKPRGVTISGKTVIESGGAWRVAKTVSWSATLFCGSNR